ncbi:MAG TPA: hypothetical protein VK308_15580 [Pyrinomonadaceae bacterium]|nr:hypothetical protein [Pyrinomonadaceae bacterium]
MIEERKKNEFWNYLTTERNQPRPKGITMQRLAVVKPAAIKSDFWLDVINAAGATERTAQEFYESADQASTDSRAKFWKAVQEIIREEENQRNSKVRGKSNVSRSNAGGKRPAFNANRRKRF